MSHTSVTVTKMKRCFVCRVQKTSTEFNIHRGRSDGLQSKCRTCSAKHCREYYAHNKARIIVQITKAANKRIEANCRKLIEYLNFHRCRECGECDPVVLDLDHVRGD